MTHEMAVQIAENMIADLRKSMLAGVAAMPEEFDGVEIRWLLLDEARRFDWKCGGMLARKRACNNWYRTSPTF